MKTLSFIKKNKYVIYLATVAVLCAGLSIAARASADFAEWYSRNVYPIFVGTIGRFFGIFPFSVSEILLMLVILGVITGIVLFILRLRRLKKANEKRLPLWIKTGKAASVVAATALLIFILNCGLNYNRHIFLLDEQFGFGADNTFEKHGDEYELERWMVFLTMLDDYYKSGAESQIQLDENGVFMLTADIGEVAPAAMRNLAAQFPRLDVHYPRPKPLINSELMTAAWLLGVYSPFTMEANYNAIAPDSEIAVTALHELVHVAGFMREEDANFIAFLAARNSGHPELVYSAYLDVLGEFRHELMCDYIYPRLPQQFRRLFVQLLHRAESLCEDEEAYSPALTFGEELLPRQIRVDLDARNRFWLDRSNDISYVVDEESGEVVETIITANPVVSAASSISFAVNDTYLRIQGQSDGILSYGRMSDLVVAFYMAEIFPPEARGFAP
jgi:hypothetical protein